MHQTQRPTPGKPPGGGSFLAKEPVHPQTNGCLCTLGGALQALRATPNRHPDRGGPEPPLTGPDDGQRYAPTPDPHGCSAPWQLSWGPTGPAGPHQHDPPPTRSPWSPDPPATTARSPPPPAPCQPPPSPT